MLRSIPRYISTIEAGELLGCSPQKAVHALRDEKLVAGPPDYCSYLWERESTVAVIERLLSVVEDEPASFIFNAEEHVIATQIMEIMGVNRDTVTLMQKTGADLGGSSERAVLFFVSEVAAFRERYLCGKDLAEALEANTKNPGMAPIWFAKRLGLVPVFAPPAGRIQIFDRIEFVEAVRKFEIERQAEEERQAKIAEIPVLASLEAAARLRLVPAFLSRVVKAGLLSGEERKRCFVFTIDEIERFERTYILATEASEFIGKKGAMTAVAALARLGVAPVVPYKEIGGYIYERSRHLTRLAGFPRPLVHSLTSKTGRAIRSSSELSGRLLGALLLPSLGSKFAHTLLAGVPQFGLTAFTLLRERNRNGPLRVGLTCSGD